MPYRDKLQEKEYQHNYHLRTWSLRKSRHLKLKKQRRASLALWLKTYKETLQCITCGENHPSCIDFHHIDAKEKKLLFQK